MTALYGYVPVAHAEESPKIVIGEIAWAGSIKSTADEWLELWNRSDVSAPIGGWSLVGAGESGKRITFAADAVIPARSAYVVSNYAKGDEKTTLDVTPNVVTTTIALSNSALKIELRDEADAVIDAVGDGGTPAAGASLPTKLTMIRTDPSLNGTDESAWSSATTSVGLIADINDLGTPSVCDFCGVDELTADPTTSTEPVSAPEPIPEPELAIEAPTSTSTTIPEPAEEPATTSTPSEPAPEPIPEPELAIEAPTSTSTSETTSEPTEETSAPTIAEPEAEPELPKPAYGMLRLSEIFPNPDSGKEWVEIVSLDVSAVIPLAGCELHDASGKIFTFDDLTIDPARSTYLRIEISSSKLNNGGDTVVLYDPDGRVLDAITYDATDKGTSWSRFPSPDGAWRNTSTPTPDAPNEWEEAVEPPLQTSPAPSPAPVPTSQPTSTKTILPPPISALSLEASKRSYETWDGKTTIVTKGAPKAPAPKSSPPSVSSKSNKTVSTKAAPKSTSKTTASKSPTSITFDMRTSDTFADIQVRLTGSVGTPPGLLPNRAFVLLAADGRGLEVRVPSSKKLPPQGQAIDLTGKLVFTSEGMPYLRLATSDSWTASDAADPVPQPRIADLAAPDAEDAWSLVQVTGTVMSVNASTIGLDLGDATVDIYVRPVASYRAKRLVAGDSVVVRGVLDAAHDPVRILPRNADDIRIISHAAKSTETNGTSAGSIHGVQLPPWMPFGTAAGAVAAAEGAKRINRLRKRRGLEQMLTKPAPGSVSK